MFLCWLEQICCWPEIWDVFNVLFPGDKGYQGVPLIWFKHFFVPLPHHWSFKHFKTVPLQARQIHPENAGARECHGFSVCRNASWQLLLRLIICFSPKSPFFFQRCPKKSSPCLRYGMFTWILQGCEICALTTKNRPGGWNLIPKRRV